MMTLFEESLSRIYSFYKKEDFAILTSWKRQTPDSKWVKQSVNNQRFQQFKMAIPKQGFAHMHLVCTGIEHASELKKMFPLKEPSVLIPNRKYTQDDFNCGILKAHPVKHTFDEFTNGMCLLGLFIKDNPQSAIIIHNHKNQTTYLIDPTTRATLRQFKDITHNELAECYCALGSISSAQLLHTPTEHLYTFQEVRPVKIPQQWITAWNHMAHGELFEMSGEEGYIAEIQNVMAQFQRSKCHRIYMLG